MPSHAHAMMAASFNATTSTPSGQTSLAKSTMNACHAPGDLVELNDQTLTPAGGSKEHNNMQPFLALNFVISLQGTFPPKP